MSWTEDGVDTGIMVACAFALGWLLCFLLTGCVAIPITVGDTAGGTVDIHTEILKGTKVLGQ